MSAFPLGAAGELIELRQSADDPKQTYKLYNSRRDIQHSCKMIFS